MTTTVVEPEVLVGPATPVVVVGDTRKHHRKNKSLAKKIAKRLRKMARKWAFLGKKARKAAWRKIRALRAKMVFVARRAGRTIRNAASSAKMGAARAGHWTIGVAGSIWSRAGSRTRAAGRAVVRGVGYVGYGTSVAYGWMAQTVQGAFFLTSLGIIGALAIGIKISDWWVESYEYDAKFWRWISMGKKKRNKIRRADMQVPYLWKRGVKHPVGDGGPMTRRERFLNKVSSVVMGQKVVIGDVYDPEDDEAIGPDDTIISGEGAGVGITSPWAVKGDPRMDEYEGMTLYDVLERHTRRLDYVTDHQDLDQRSYWSGRVYFLTKYLDDEANLSRLDALYNEWRDQQPKKRGPGPRGLMRMQFREGMIDERRILREEHVLKSEAQQAAQEAMAGAGSSG